MINKISQLMKDNECIKRRYERALKANNIKEMYAARAEYQENIDKQRDELRTLDKSSDEYKQAKVNIENQQRQAYGMRYTSNDENKDDLREIEGLMYKYERENEALSKQMDEAIKKGDTQSYDELRHKYTTNLKAQEGISSQIKLDNRAHESSIVQQSVIQRDLDIDMRNKMAEKIQSSKKPSEIDKANLEKYQNLVKSDERQALEKNDRKKLDEMESRGLDDKSKLDKYGLPRDLIQLERENLERSRSKLLGEDHSK